ncbi:serine/arginine repetitive matrix protein 1 [Cocos nucifera]|uniref:Serine/arginine repetitive matrix protein 1 n=1 Tax=Cocos nucifera TaxID=13894 RepID=A0A8K0IPW9_COCNU|nr:serine/arginine repetitive matrix protein 1 [Cocos nucifera]
MARSGDPEREIWGTWEELLLSCAVNRHGTRSWDAVAMEVQARSTFAHLLTPQSCRHRYRHLQRRFANGIDGGSGDDDSAAAGGDDSAAAEVPWLEELRKLRVAELRREVERYDLSIGSLQLKVKKLKEERERSLRETGSGEREDDLKDDEKKDSGSPGSTPGSLAGDGISGGDPSRSCNESNSTDPKEEEGKPGREDGKPEEEPGSCGREADPAAGGAEKASGEGSYNGSSDTIAKGAAAAAAADLPRAQRGESGESVAESKGGEAEAEGEKESSDVQSSASLSRRRKGWRRKATSGSSGGGGGGGGGGEQEADGDSLIAKRIAAESQPLVSFLETIRSNKYGSVFERRLESQITDISIIFKETGRYRSVIRQHVDLEMVRAKMERGGGRVYASVELFRDLLLLCNNAIVFYPKHSPESTAAVHLRELVVKEMAATTRKPDQPPHAVESAPPSLPPPQQPKFKKDPDLAGSLFEKSTSPTPIIACRKRSSISTKAKKEEMDEKPDSDRKERENEEQNLSAKKSNNKERSATRGWRTNKNRGGNRAGGGGGAAAAANSLNSVPAPSHKSKLVEITAAEQVVKAEKKSGGGAAAASKRSAVSFLNRMKRSSPSPNGTLLEKLKGSSSVGSGRGAAEQKKGVKGECRKDQSSRQGGGSNHSKKAPEPSAPAKRSVGRPPKRAAAPPTPPPAKKAREEAETATAKPPLASSRKRGRR